MEASPLSSFRGLACDRWFSLLAPHLPGDVADRAALERLQVVMAGLPGSVSGAIEIRLGASEKSVDLAVRISNPAEARQIAAWIQPDYVQQFLSDWAREPDPRIPFLWLEFDLPPQEADLHSPLMISRIVREAEPLWLVEDLLPAIRGRALTPSQRQLALRSLEELSGRAYCCYAFDLQARGTDLFRLSFTDLMPADMPSYLERLGRPDLAREILLALELVPDGDLYEMNFDVNARAEIGSRIGIEVSFQKWPGRDPRWEALLDRLTAEGLCCPEKRSAVLSWFGYDSPRIARDRWPLVSGPPDAFLIRWISHFKLACLPGRSLEAKAYLSFGLWTRSSDGRLKEGGAFLYDL
jgi:hypothetical protein